MSTSILGDLSFILPPDNSTSVSVVINIFECSSKKPRFHKINLKLIIIMQKNVPRHLGSLHQCSALGVSERDGVGLLPDLHKKIVTKNSIKNSAFFKIED